MGKKIQKSGIASARPEPPAEEPRPKMTKVTAQRTTRARKVSHSDSEPDEVADIKKQQAEFPSHPHYLMKSEPSEFSFQALQEAPGQTSPWDGVRNAQATKIMRGMRTGTQVFFYHSATRVPAIVGIAEVCKEAYPDHTAFDKKSKYYDPNSNEDKPRWHMVDVRYVRPLKREITLEELRRHAGGPLANMALLRQSRLSVGPVTQEQWDFILSLEEGPGGTGGQGAQEEEARPEGAPAKKGGKGRQGKHVEASVGDVDGEEGSKGKEGGAGGEEGVNGRKRKAGARGGRKG